MRLLLQMQVCALVLCTCKSWPGGIFQTLALHLRCLTSPCSANCPILKSRVPQTWAGRRAWCDQTHQMQYRLKDETLCEFAQTLRIGTVTGAGFVPMLDRPLQDGTAPHHEICAAPTIPDDSRVWDLPKSEAACQTWTATRLGCHQKHHMQHRLEDETLNLLSPCTLVGWQLFELDRRLKGSTVPHHETWAAPGSPLILQPVPQLVLLMTPESATCPSLLVRLGQTACLSDLGRYQTLVSSEAPGVAQAAR